MPPNDDPAQLLAQAQDYARDLRFSEALERYRSYLCMCPQDEQVRQAMHDLENRRADYVRLREVYELADKCSFRLQLRDATLSELLTGLHRALCHGASLEAEEMAGQVLQQLEDVMRREWGLTVQDDLWWEAVQRASERDFYDRPATRSSSNCLRPSLARATFWNSSKNMAAPKVWPADWLRTGCERPSSGEICKPSKAAAANSLSFSHRMNRTPRTIRRAWESPSGPVRPG